ncbi:hypothetical protein COT42_03750 [Candidatus Saganbacteria bacterium CG08_land_8_20_14_0_20_45_16]|uniref:Uncharacterized protein n=1 Tax=Candidatus Saganbacteria bacterium CG08_land_8_20_14_0_20_45_16 TaxID=2014293 RepID=A0A2H0XYH5_UNCSA|nr:MAG: hypothetical protein COT42_03750 [Candidatus Saganbacteria bacterium CG08_land_8_20_14_0_20_45_16]
MGISAIVLSQFNNLVTSVLPDREDASSSVSLLSLIPARYAFLFVLLAAINDCVLSDEVPPSRPDVGGDGGEDAAGDADEPICVSYEEIPNDGLDQNCDGYDDLCSIGEEIETYSGPDDTEGVGICEAQFEECQLTSQGMRFVVVREATLPRDEFPRNGGG